MSGIKLIEMEEILLKLGGSYMLNHAKRTLHLSKLIAEKENIPYNESILVFACYFHDISAYPPYRPEGAFDHALESSKIMPKLAKDFGYNDEEIQVIVEAVKYHDKVGMGEYNETRLVRNSDGIDYLGYMAVARDFSKQPKDMQKAMMALKSRKGQFYSIIDYDFAKKLAEPRLKELENFINAFDVESFGMY